MVRYICYICRQENPFAGRICVVFSSKPGTMNFTEFLSMLSVFSASASRDIKSMYAFKLYGMKTRLTCVYILSHNTYYYWYSITHSLFHSRLKSFLFCKSSLPQPFFFLLQDSLYGFPRLFTDTSEHIRLFSYFLFLHFFSCRFRAVD